MSEYLAEVDLDGQASEQARLSGAVTTYFIPKEEMERLYGKPEPQMPKRHVGWPECGQPNLRHIARQPSTEIGEDDADEVDPEEAVDVDEIERIESGATDPAWSFDNCKW